MTSLDDRVTRLENAFVELVSLARDLTEGQNRMQESLIQVVQTQNRMQETLIQVVQTQNRMLETIQEHSDLLRGIVGTLQEHSTDLTIIKSYLGSQG